ncbi:MAG TPA: NUDIX hydrolase [Pseudomonadales bacterium]|nr:NUDIX hydrolase [Pseudomonadales bacterium]
MEWAPHVTVATVVERDGKFLLVHEFDTFRQQMVYNQPAGHWDEGETLLAGAIRETREETAWEVQLTHWLGLYSYLAPSNGFMYLRIAFVGTALQYLDTPLDEGIHEAVWLDYDTILAKEAAGELRSPLVLKVIEDYRSGRRLSLESLYEHTPL